VLGHCHRDWPTSPSQTCTSPVPSQLVCFKGLPRQLKAQFLPHLGFRQCNETQTGCPLGPSDSRIAGKRCKGGLGKVSLRPRHLVSLSQQLPCYVQAFRVLACGNVIMQRRGPVDHRHSHTSDLYTYIDPHSYTARLARASWVTGDDSDPSRGYSGQGSGVQRAG
jgi:hypothetical protein